MTRNILPEGKGESADRTIEEVRWQTEEIQKAIDSVFKAGGGRVILEPGLYVTTTLFLKSRVNLHLCAGAVLQAWGNISDYPRFPHGNQHPRQEFHYIYAEDEEDISLTGEGVIDGNCYAFWDIPPREFIRQGGTLEEMNLSFRPEDDSPFWIPHRERLMPMVELRNCRRVRIIDITLKDSAGWTLHPTLCDDVWITRLTIDNCLYGPNTDGIDISGCRNVWVTDCKVSCGDDAIIIKAMKHTRSCEHITVSGCILRTHCAALGIGAEVYHPIREVTFTNCAVPKALRIVQIELWDAGLVENVTISNITGANMTDIPLERPLYIDIQQHRRTDGALGVVRNVSITGITCLSRGRCLFTAQDGSTIEGLTLRDIHITVPEIEDPEISVPSSRSGQMSNFSPETRSKRALFIFDNCHRVLMDNIQVTWPGEDTPAEKLRISSDKGHSYPGDSLFDRDIRKQAAVKKKVPLHAIYARRSSSFVINAPFLRGYETEDDRVFVECENIVRNQ
jgi:hypothetical protein